MQTKLAVPWHPQHVASPHYCSDIKAQIGPDLLIMPQIGKALAAHDGCTSLQPVLAGPVRPQDRRVFCVRHTSRNASEAALQPEVYTTVRPGRHSDAAAPAVSIGHGGGYERRKTAYDGEK